MCLYNGIVPLFKKYILKKTLILVVVILLIDQISKFYIKTHMFIGQEFIVFPDWFIIHFTENNGMAFGMQFAGQYGKLILSVFRIVAIIAIGYYLYYLIRKKSHKILIVSIALIFTGALGNIIDSVFYGILFSESNYNQMAELFPAGGGYAGVLHGKVVDMLYFPLIDIHRNDAPSWFPSFLFGGDSHFVFFRPVFNIADSAITIGVFLLLFCQKKFYKSEK